MVCMLYIRWTYVNKVAINFVKHGCLLNEPMCIKGIKVKPVNEKIGVSVSTVFMKDEFL